MRKTLKILPIELKENLSVTSNPTPIFAFTGPTFFFACNSAPKITSISNICISNSRSFVIVILIPNLRIRDKTFRTFLNGFGAALTAGTPPDRNSISGISLINSIPRLKP